MACRQASLCFLVRKMVRKCCNQNVIINLQVKNRGCRLYFVILLMQDHTMLGQVGFVHGLDDEMRSLAYAKGTIFTS